MPTKTQVVVVLDAPFPSQLFLLPSPRHFPNRHGPCCSAMIKPTPIPPDPLPALYLRSGGFAYHTTMPTDALAVARDSMALTKEFGFDRAKAAALELGARVRAVLCEDRGLVSVAAPGFQAPGVVVVHTDDAAVLSKFLGAGTQVKRIQAGWGEEGGRALEEGPCSQSWDHGRITGRRGRRVARLGGGSVLGRSHRRRHYAASCSLLTHPHSPTQPQPHA
jgi:hypothetical protein